MPLLQVSSLGFSFGSREILKDVSFFLDRGTRLALSGANGSGKTTLLRLICGQMETHQGSVHIEKTSRIGYLPQSLDLNSSLNLYQEAETAYAYYTDIQTQLHQLEETLPQLSGQELDRALHAQHDFHELLNNSSFYMREKEIAVVLAGLGFERGDFERPCQDFSGGWQMRIALAKILLEAPDVLLLDEPTNYLDIEAREWLESWLAKFAGGVLMVSHDRHFLDRTVSGVAELYLGKLTVYRGNYSTYEARRKLELEQILRDYEIQRAEIEKLEDFISRFRANASKAPMVQSRVKTLEKIVPIEIPEGLKRIHFQFPPAPRSGDICLRTESLTKSYPGKPILHELDIEVRRGEKIALVGKNGAGKSTLLRVLSGRDRDHSGSVRLGAVLFRGDDVFKPVRVLSGGEKNRLALVLMLLTPANLLILDEPTNHLDLASKDILQDALRRFEGTVIFVSHDHDFIQALADRVLEVRIHPTRPAGPRQVRNFPGDYEYYRYRLQSEESGETGSPSAEAPGRTGPRVEALAAQAMDREELKQLKAQIRRLEREEEELLTEIEAAEQKKTSLASRLSDPKVYTDGARAREIAQEISAVEGELAQLSVRWEQCSAKLTETQGLIGDQA